MKKLLIIGLLAGMVSCAGSGTKSTQEEDKVAADVSGQWYIENVVENDSSYVRPSEIDGGVTAYIVFKDDNTFGVMTGCNHIGGQYTIEGDSIRLADILSTEMACDNMEVEDMLKKILPEVNAVDCLNDSVMRLNCSTPASYILLRKSPLEVK